MLLLSKSFLDSCRYAYADFPGGQENQGQPFVSKHFNVIDPLRVNNNLGRSVSKGALTNYILQFYFFCGLIICCDTVITSVHSSGMVNVILLILF